jgi:hypothetical protein
MGLAMLKLVCSSQAQFTDAVVTRRVYPSVGGFIGRNKRVNGVLAISRALGDHMLKENTAVVSAEPYTLDTELESGDSYIILACDGVWDVMTDQEAADFALEQIKKYDAQLQHYLASQNGSNANTTEITPTNDGTTPANADTSSSNAENNTSAADTSANAVTQPHRAGESKIETDVTMSYADDEHSNNTTGAASNLGHSQKPDEISFPKHENDVMYLVSKALVQEALDRRSLDNVTVMMIKL